MSDPRPSNEPLLAENVDQVLHRVVEELRDQSDSLATPLRKNARGQPLPSRDEIIGAVERLRGVLFPGYFGNGELTEEAVSYYVGATLHRTAQGLAEQIRRGLCFACERELCDCSYAECEERSKQHTAALIARLPELQRLLALDALATYEGDPAAGSPSEAIFCYPGMMALTNHRIAHELYRMEIPLIPRIISESAHSVTGIDIHPGAQIGEKLFIDHGTGVVIGETCIIGDRVRIYQGVTLGAKSFPLDEDGKPRKGIARHPIVEDDVTIYSGATILGRVRIGAGSVIGGNVWVTRSVPAGSRISQSRPRSERFEAGAGI